MVGRDHSGVIWQSVSLFIHPQSKDVHLFLLTAAFLIAWHHQDEPGNILWHPPFIRRLWQVPLSVVFSQVLTGPNLSAFLCKRHPFNSQFLCHLFLVRMVLSVNKHLSVIRFSKWVLIFPGKKRELKFEEFELLWYKTSKEKF